MSSELQILSSAIKFLHKCFSSNHTWSGCFLSYVFCSMLGCWVTSTSFSITMLNSLPKVLLDRFKNWAFWFTYCLKFQASKELKHVIGKNMIWRIVLWKKLWSKAGQKLRCGYTPRLERVKLTTAPKYFVNPRENREHRKPTLHKNHPDPDVTQESESAKNAFLHSPI